MSAFFRGGQLAPARWAVAFASHVHRPAVLLLARPFPPGCALALPAYACGLTRAAHVAMSGDGSVVGAAREVRVLCQDCGRRPAPRLEMRLRPSAWAAPPDRAVAAAPAARRLQGTELQLPRPRRGLRPSTRSVVVAVRMRAFVAGRRCPEGRAARTLRRSPWVRPLGCARGPGRLAPVAVSGPEPLRVLPRSSSPAWRAHRRREHGLPRPA